MLSGKNIVVGICGGIAAYKAADLVSRLVQAGAEVDVMMTKAACEFVAPLTFSTLSQRPVVVDMFENPINWEVEHISLAQKADCFVIAPATANVIGKIACGIADDMLTTTVMATKCPVIIAPAMNINMYENPIVKANMEKLTSLGYWFVESQSGRLACGTIGYGRLADNQLIVDNIKKALAIKSDLAGLKILVSAGPTREYVDPVRFISNPSSGKMGYAIAENAVKRGAQVTLVSGPVHLSPPLGVRVVNITSAEQMHQVMIKEAKKTDIVVKAAAVGDFRSASQSAHKIKKDEIKTIELVKNPDILQDICALPGKRIVVGFCMETHHLSQNAQAKLIQKGVDMIVANEVGRPDVGFSSDNNAVLIYYKNSEKKEEMPTMPKTALAGMIIDRALALYRGIKK